MKKYVVVSCPIDTYSGYGARARDLVKALIKARPDFEVRILSQRWGNTRFGYLKDHKEKEKQNCQKEQETSHSCLLLLITAIFRRLDI